ncbi:hypothetical protein V5799_011016, partial [Amblyomma americanum]
KDILVHYIISKEHPDRGVGTISNDTSNPIPAQVVYSDYRSCMIDKMFLGSQTLCLQWVTPGTENAVPEECSAAMNTKCSGSVLLYSDDACK